MGSKARDSSWVNACVREGKGGLEQGAQREAGSAGIGLGSGFHCQITPRARREPGQVTQVVFSI